MTISHSNVEVSTDTFSTWLTRTNQMLEALRTKVVTADSNTTSGNVAISGAFTADALFINSITGGVFGNTQPITISSNVAISSNFSVSGNSSANNIAANNVTSGNGVITNVTSNTITSNTIYLNYVYGGVAGNTQPIEVRSNTTFTQYVSANNFSAANLNITESLTVANTDQAKVALELVPGTDVQTQDALLQSIADLTTSANQMVYFTGADAAATTSLSGFGRSLIDDANAEVARATMNLGSLAILNALPDDIGSTSNIASNTTIDLSSVDTIRVLITGNTFIEDFGNNAVNTVKLVTFDEDNILIANSSLIKLTNDANLAVSAEDVCTFVSDDSGIWTLTNYQPKAGFTTGAGSSIFIDTFTGNGSNTVYTLSVTPTTENQCMVFQSGVLQYKNTFNVVGANVIFSTPPANGIPIEVTTLGAETTEIVSTAAKYNYTYTAAGGETSISGNDDNAQSLAYTVGFVNVYLNGVKLNEGTDFTANTGTTITDLDALVAGQVLEVEAWTPIQVVANTVQPPISSQDNAIVKFDGATGKIIQDSNVFITDSEGLTNLASVNGGPLNGFRNKIINGDFEIAQRGTSGFTSNEYTLDRWVIASSGTTHNVSQQAFTLGQTDVPGNPSHYIRCAVTSSAGASNFSYLRQKIEYVKTLSGKTATLTFYAKADAVKDFALTIYQNFGTGGSPSTQVSSNIQKITLGTSWQKYSIVLSIPSISGKTLGSNDNDTLQIAMWFDAGSSLNADTDSLGQQSGTFDFAHMSLVEGDATNEDDPFSLRQIQQEYDLCYRYYYQSSNTPGNDTWRLYSLAGTSTNGNLRGANIHFPVVMRALPSVSVTPSVGSAVYEYFSGDHLAVRIDAGNNTSAVTITNVIADAEL